MASLLPLRRNWALTLCAILLLAIVASVAHAEEDPGADMPGIVAMDDASFAELVGKDRGVLVEFYAPWCGHCKTMAPEFRALGALYENTAAAHDKLVIGKVDATKHNGISVGNGVSGFPTILYFPPHSTTGEKYTESRTTEAMLKFLNRKIAGLGMFIPKQPQFAQEVTADDFDAVVVNSKKDVMVLMYAPWCGHCKNLKPVYNQLAKIYENEEDVVIAMFDADAKNHKAIGAKYKINGYPTVLFFGKNNKDEPLEYEGARELEDLVVYVNEHTGKMRLLDGDLSWNYGVEEAVSKAIAAVAKAADSKRAALAVKAKEAAEKIKGAGAEYYAKVAERVATDVDYIKTEKARLDRMLKGSVAGKKRDELALRFNILSSIEDKL